MSASDAGASQTSVTEPLPAEAEKFIGAAGAVLLFLTASSVSAGASLLARSFRGFVPFV